MRAIVEKFRENLDNSKFKKLKRPARYTTFDKLIETCKKHKDENFLIMVDSNDRAGKTSLVKYIAHRFSHGHNNDSKEV